MILNGRAGRKETNKLFSGLMKLSMACGNFCLRFQMHRWDAKHSSIVYPINANAWCRGLILAPLKMASPSIFAIEALLNVYMLLDDCSFDPLHWLRCYSWAMNRNNYMFQLIFNAPISSWPMRMKIIVTSSEIYQMLK